MKLLLMLVLPLTLAAQGWTELIPHPDATEWKPITQKDRAQFFLHSTFNGSNLFNAAVSASVLQARGRPEEWRQGLDGWAIRAGNNLARTGIRNSIRWGVSSALREDTRYISSNRAGTGARLWYAVSTTYTSFDRQGHRRFSVSKFVSNGGTAALNRYWLPPSWQGGGHIAGDFALTSLIQAGYNVGREFAPDIIKRFRR